MHDILDFLQPVPYHEISNDESYYDGQLARHIETYIDELPDVSKADVVLVGVQETRGQNFFGKPSAAADAIRRQLYKLHYWHTDIKIADVGNVKTGETLADSYAAIATVVSALLQKNKTVVMLGGTHDCTLGQYDAYRKLNRPVEASCIDAKIDLQSETPIRSDNFLMEMLTEDPAMIRHYNHIGFQTYLVHPRLIETLDKLRFDCYRVGSVIEKIEEMEPVLRSTNLLSVDISAIKNADAPANKECPNGFTGIEACTLTRFAGMSENLSSIGFYGYFPEADKDDLTARQISQMVWYFIDGKNRGRHEAHYDDKHNFNEYHTAFAEVDTIFLQSKKTGRWWMQMPDRKLIACSQADYVKASHNEIPERWLRVQEREV